jgi:hypothetical protein
MRFLKVKLGEYEQLKRELEELEREAAAARESQEHVE